MYICLMLRRIKSSLATSRYPKWHLLYYVLALFDLVAISLSLFATHSILGNYSQSIAVNKAWADRSARFSELERMVGDVNAPGNDVFDTLNVPLESQRMDTALVAYNAAFESLKADLPPGRDLEYALVRIGSSTDTMVRLARRIFADFAAGRRESAGAEMANMDRDYAQVLHAFRNARQHIAGIQDDLFNAQAAASERLRRLEAAIAASILIIVCAVALYGRKLSGIASKAWQEQDQRAADLRRDQARLEAGIAAGTADLAAANERLRRADRIKDEFLATLSHELRTPLTAIVGWTDLMKNGRLDANDQAKALEIIMRNAMEQTTMVGELLDVSRIMIGTFKIQPEVQELEPILADVMDSLRPAARAKDITLKRSVDPAVRRLALDSTRFRQVIRNLLGNSLKFTPAGGQIALVATQNGDFLELSVRDTGQGIAPEFLPYVFERFRQANSSSTRSHGGLGLGLAIVKDLVEIHGGTVAAASGGPGQGATFTVRLPSHVADPDRSARRVQPAGPSARTSIAGWDVLVVEDDEETLSFICAGLKLEGAVVHPARTAAEALGAIGRTPFHLMISDIGLPGEDGYSLMRRIRSNPGASARVPRAVALTAYAGESDKEKAVDAGFDVFVAKPVTIPDLVGLIDWRCV